MGLSLQQLHKYRMCKDLLETLKIINRKLGTALNLHPKTIILTLKHNVLFFKHMYTVFYHMLVDLGVSMSTDH